MVTAVFNSLAGSGVLTKRELAGLRARNRTGWPDVDLHYFRVQQRLSPDNLVITINRGWVCGSSGHVHLGHRSRRHQRDGQYPYHWRFNSVIQLLFPGASYGAKTTVDGERYGPQPDVRGMRRTEEHCSGRKNEQGIIIMLVAVFMLFVVGAMAALSIDVVTLYTARSEAQLAADGAALAGARVLANSGATSDHDWRSMSQCAEPLAQAVAIQVAEQNTVGGGTSTRRRSRCPANFGGTYYRPDRHRTVQITDLPTFFARIWGTQAVTVGASATAEAYNPSGACRGGVAQRRSHPFA